jgi:hypothetical protein
MGNQKRRQKVGFQGGLSKHQRRQKSGLSRWAFKVGFQNNIHQKKRKINVTLCVVVSGEYS